MKRVMVIVIPLLFLAWTASAHAEPTLLQIVNEMMDTDLTAEELDDLEVLDDEFWFEMNGHITITATYAAYIQELHWVTDEDSGFILSRDEDGYSYDVEEFNTTGGAFYFENVATNPGGGEYTWFSVDEMNNDLADHMVTYDMRDYEDWTFICAFEDLPNLGDGDYNDLVFKITLAAPTSVCDDGGCPQELAACPQPFVSGGHGTEEDYFYPRDPVIYSFDYQILGGQPDTQYKVTGIAYSWYPGRLVSDNQRTAKRIEYVTGPGNRTLSFSKKVPGTVDFSFGDPYGVTVEWTFEVKEVGGAVIDTCETVTHNAFYVESKP
jgi:hypothetical protein